MSESSGDDDAHDEPTSRGSTRSPTSTSDRRHEIAVYRDGVNGNLKLLSPEDKSPLYYVRSSIFRRGVPDITLLAGSDKNGPVIGVCNYIATSIAVGRGDPTNPNGVDWEEVSKESWDHSRYKFSIPSSTTRQRKSYSWKRTHDPTLKGTQSSKFGMRSWKLEDEATQQVVAVFAAIKGWKKVGKFRFLTTEGEEWEEWVLLTHLGLYEKARRRAMARRDLSWFM